MKLKVIATVLLVVSLIASGISFSAHAIVIDGFIEALEWQHGKEFIVVSTSDKSNCDISYAVLTVSVNDDERRIYLCAKCAVSCVDNVNAGLFGVAVYLNGDRVAAFSELSLNECDTERYAVDAAFDVEETTREFYAEMYVGVKFGVPQSLGLGIQLYDFCGAASNYYELSVRSETQSQQTQTETTTESRSKKATTSAVSTKPAATDETHKTSTAPQTTTVFTTVAYVPAVLFSSTNAEISVQTAAKKQRSIENESSVAAEKTTKSRKSASRKSAAAATSTAETHSEAALSESETAAEISDCLTVDSGDKGNKTIKKKIAGLVLAGTLLVLSVICAVVLPMNKSLPKKAPIESCETLLCADVLLNEQDFTLPETENPPL